MSNGALGRWPARDGVSANRGWVEGEGEVVVVAVVVVVVGCVCVCVCVFRKSGGGGGGGGHSHRFSNSPGHWSVPLKHSSQDLEQQASAREDSKTRTIRAGLSAQTYSTDSLVILWAIQRTRVALTLRTLAGLDGLLDRR